MKDQQKNLVVSIAGVLVIVGLLWWGANRSTSEAIVIGADYAMSGAYAPNGQWASNGINLAVKEINERGGIHGRPLQMVFEDSQGKPAVAVSAFQKLRSEHSIQYVITFQSGIALAVAPLANQNQVIQMDVSATTPNYSSPDDYTFRTSIIATDLARAAAKVLFDQLKVNQIALLSINNDFGSGMVKVFKDTYPGKILAEEKFNEGSTDFRTELTKIKDSGAQSIFLVGNFQTAGLIVRQAKEAGLPVQFFSEVHSVESPDFLEAANQAGEGIIYVTPKFDPNRSDITKNFTNRYRETYNEEPNFFAAQSYDGIIALAKAFEQCSAMDTGCVKTKLFNLSFEGASGVIDFDQNGDVKKDVEIKQIKNNQFIPYQP